MKTLFLSDLDGTLIRSNEQISEYTANIINRFVKAGGCFSYAGRLGLFIHVTAGFGDIGFSGYWTLEIQCIQPVKIYPMVEICQIYYHTLDGEFESYKSGKYQNNTGIQPSLLYKDFEKPHSK